MLLLLYLLLPANGLQLTSLAHVVPQADETLSEALIYVVTVACGPGSCLQGRYRDWGWGWKTIG